MIAWLRLVPVWVYALAAALAWGAFQHHRATEAGARALAAERDLADTRATAAKTAIDTLARIVADQGEAVREAEDQSTRNRAHADAASTAARRLRDAAATAAVRGCSTSAPAAASSAPASTTGALLADMLGGLGEAAQQYAKHADAARTAGQLCERSYDAVKVRVAPPAHSE